MAVVVFIHLVVLFTYWGIRAHERTIQWMEIAVRPDLRMSFVYFSPCDVYTAHGTVFYDLFKMNKNN
jgi:hypothetical protein